MHMSHRLPRRSLFALALSIPLGLRADEKPVQPRVATAGRRWQSLDALYSKATVPDLGGRTVLARRLGSLSQGMPAGTPIGQSLHKNFPQLVEQGIARMRPGRADSWVASLSPYELRRLAHLYAQASNDAGHTPLLHDLLATRLRAELLGRISPELGFSSLYASTAKLAPSKTDALVRSYQQELGSRLLNPAAAREVVSMLDYTIEEIYLSFRTAPVGSLSVRAALYETGVYVGKNFFAAYGIGYGIGTGLAWFTETYFPSVWDFIGELIHNFVESIHDAGTPEEMGDALYHGAGAYQIESEPYAGIAYGGGDFGIAREWSDAFGGGNSCAFIPCDEY